MRSSRKFLVRIRSRRATELANAVPANEWQERLDAMNMYRQQWLSLELDSREETSAEVARASSSIGDSAAPIVPNPEPDESTPFFPELDARNKSRGNQPAT